MQPARRSAPEHDPYMTSEHSTTARWSTEPWQRMDIDYAELNGQQFLLVAGSHSKWMEVFLMRSTTAEATIEVLRAVFSIWAATGTGQ